VPGHPCSIVNPRRQSQCGLHRRLQDSPAADRDQPPEPRGSCLCVILLHFLRLQHRVREEANLWQGANISRAMYSKRIEGNPTRGSRMLLPTCSSGGTFLGKRIRSEMFSLSVFAAPARLPNAARPRSSNSSASTPRRCSSSQPVPPPSDNKGKSGSSPSQTVNAIHSNRRRSIPADTPWTSGFIPSSKAGCSPTSATVP
jgi:hypothetical protein